MVPLNRMDTFCFNRFVLLGWSAAVVFESQSTQTVDLKDVGIAGPAGWKREMKGGGVTYLLGSCPPTVHSDEYPHTYAGNIHTYRILQAARQPDRHTDLQTYRHKCIQTYILGRDSELLPGYFHHALLCRSPVFVFTRPRLIRCCWISIGDAGVRPKEMRVWMVFALTKPLDSRAKDGVISAEMSMQTSSICPTSICLFRMGGSDGTRSPRRCLQVRHQILIWKMHWSEAPSKMEEQKCWKETH